MEKLGLIDRVLQPPPRVSNDNPFSEALFGPANIAHQADQGVLQRKLYAQAWVEILRQLV